ncbi:MAG: hypothetical protein WC752_02570 [Patescibacteria group bacterium]|jgi:hypothetical protein
MERTRDKLRRSIANALNRAIFGNMDRLTGRGPDNQPIIAADEISTEATDEVPLALEVIKNGERSGEVIRGIISDQILIGQEMRVGEENLGLVKKIEQQGRAYYVTVEKDDELITYYIDPIR